MKLKISIILIIIGTSVIVGIFLYKPNMDLFGGINSLMTYEDNMAGVQIYDPDMDPYEAFRSVIDEAKNKKKSVLLVFGSDTCPDCRSLYKKMHTKPLNETIDKNFIVMHVDIGNWDNNIDFTNQFGEPVKFGTPSIAILGSNSTIYYVSKAGEFASARSSKTKTLNEWFLDMVKKIENIQREAHIKKTTTNELLISQRTSSLVWIIAKNKISRLTAQNISVAHNYNHLRII